MYKISDQVMSTEVGSDIIVLNLNDGEYYGLTHLSKEIWKTIESNTSIEELIKEVHMNSGMDYETVSKDFIDCIDQLKEMGLIRAC